MNTFNPHGDDDLSVPPVMAPGSADDAHSAPNFIRAKLDQIYAEEPDAMQELSEAATKHARRSKHQQFMYDLGTSGKDLATIQTEWHRYYEGLSDEEKHAVWREFYASQAALTNRDPVISNHPAPPLPKQNAAASLGRAAGALKGGTRLGDNRSAKEIREALRHRVSAGGQLKAKHHLQSVLFGLGMGCIVVIIFLFGFFNEVFLAPFIQPSRASASTPLIVSSDSIAPSSTPEVIIPKINVQIPVDYNETSSNEAAIENDLEHGIVHYPTTVLPGQNGNAAFFGHSSNNIFNKGKYKFAFVLLHTLENGDTFYLTYNGKVYVYKVISKTVVDPSNVGVLGPVAGQTATATLITCDPPGTSLHRLIVVGQQISPDPANNTQAASTDTGAGAGPSALAGNGPTLWGRFISTAAGKITVVVVLGGGGLWVIRRLNRQPTIVTGS